MIPFKIFITHSKIHYTLNNLIALKSKNSKFTIKTTKFHWNSFQIHHNHTILSPLECSLIYDFDQQKLIPSISQICWSIFWASANVSPFLCLVKKGEDHFFCCISVQHKKKNQKTKSLMMSHSPGDQTLNFTFVKKWALKCKVLFPGQFFP